MDQQHVAELMNIEAAFAERKIKFEDALAAIEENVKMKEYFRAKGVLDENNNAKI